MSKTYLSRIFHKQETQKAGKHDMMLSAERCRISAGAAVDLDAYDTVF